MVKILFICHGNICRSPIAEIIFNKKIKEMNMDNFYYSFSSATSFEEIGNDIYPPMKKELIKRGILNQSHKANHFEKNDYDLYDYIFYMDENNKRNLDRYIMDKDNKIFPISKFTPSINEIEDPWYTGRYSYVADEIIKCVDDIIKNIVK